MNTIRHKLAHEYMGICSDVLPACRIQAIFARRGRFRKDRLGSFLPERTVFPLVGHLIFPARSAETICNRAVLGTVVRIPQVRRLKIKAMGGDNRKAATTAVPAMASQEDTRAYRTTAAPEMDLTSRSLRKLSEAALTLKSRRFPQKGSRLLCNPRYAVVKTKDRQ